MLTKALQCPFFGAGGPGKLAGTRTRRQGSEGQVHLGRHALPAQARAREQGSELLLLSFVSCGVLVAMSCSAILWLPQTDFSPQGFLGACAPGWGEHVTGLSLQFCLVPHCPEGSEGGWGHWAVWADRAARPRTPWGLETSLAPSLGCAYYQG